MASDVERNIASIIGGNRKLFYYACEVHKIQLSNEIGRILDNQIRYGPFRGLRLPPYLTWGESDRGAILLGLYEKEVCDFLAELKLNYRVFETLISFGSGFGMYGLGSVLSGLCRNAVFFELNEASRKEIFQTASLNQIDVEGKVFADARKCFEVLGIDRFERSIVICDVEGAEFDLFNEEVFSKLQSCIIIVELHEFFFADGNYRRKHLLDSSSQTHIHRSLSQSNRNPTMINELKAWNDHDRWLLCSETRARSQEWILFFPKSEQLV